VRFQISKEEILKPLQLIASVVDRRPGKDAPEVISNILLKVKGQLLSLIGTDREIELVARIPLKLPSDAGQMTIPARKMVEICRALPEGALLELYFESDRAVLKVGRGRYQLSALPSDSFPRFKESFGETEFSLTQKEMEVLVTGTAFTMAQQDVRYYLNGMLWELSMQGIRTVATDGHRLATCHLPWAHPIEADRRVIVPRKAVYELMRLFSEETDDLGISIGASHLRVVTPRYSFVAKLVEGKFPDYRQVFPKIEGHEAIISKDRLKQMLSRVSVLLSEKQRGASLMFSAGLLRVKARNSEQDEGEEEIEIDYDGPECKLGLNIGYILEYLAIAPGHFIRMQFSDPDSPVLFRLLDDDKMSYIIMPMRL